ncbi:hypothetical protein Tco_1428362 [Tanacetum coccineum]
MKVGAGGVGGDAGSGEGSLMGECTETEGHGLRQVTGSERVALAGVVHITGEIGGEVRFKGVLSLHYQQLHCRALSFISIGSSSTPPSDIIRPISSAMASYGGGVNGIG